MEQLQVFKNFMFGELTILESNGKVYFPATDVAKKLGYSNPHDAIRRHTKEKGCVNHEVLSKGGLQVKKFIDEGNLYRLITNSKLPQAEKFESWVFDEVLPDIRKQGMYATEQTIDSMLNDPDTAIQLLQNYKEEKNRRAIAELKVKELEPKAAYYDLILSNTSLITIGSIAKDYGMTAQAMNKLLHGLKVQYKQSNQWLLYAKYQAEGYVSSDPAVITHTDGTTSVRMSTKWTQKGRKFLYKLLKEHDILPVIEQEVS